MKLALKSTKVFYSLYSHLPAIAQTGQTYKSLRCLQLYIALLNNVNRNLIFTWKLLCIDVSIISGYAAIAHFKDHPIFGAMYYFIFFNASLVYILVYDQAFKVPDLFGQAVRVTLLRVGKQREPGLAVKKKVLDRQLKAVPAVGVKVGEFHTLERISTPVFLNYVLNNVVSMLVAFE